MAVFKVEGSRRLSGEIVPQGAKNEALQILCATMLTSEEVVVENLPQILDVMQLIELLAALGVEVKRLGEECYSFRANNYVAFYACVYLRFVHIWVIYSPCQ